MGGVGYETELKKQRNEGSIQELQKLCNLYLDNHPAPAHPRTENEIYSDT